MDAPQLQPLGSNLQLNLPRLQDDRAGQVCTTQSTQSRPPSPLSLSLIPAALAMQSERSIGRSKRSNEQRLHVLTLHVHVVMLHERIFCAFALFSNVNQCSFLSARCDASLDWHKSQSHPLLPTVTSSLSYPTNNSPSSLSCYYKTQHGRKSSLHPHFPRSTGQHGKADWMVR